jgi:uncharacterized integral membrane protein (TIGR00698 family)
MIRVLVVDDQKIIYQGLQEMFVSEPNIKLVGFAYNGIEAIRQILQKQPDIVLIDVLMPVMDGLEATKEITKQFPEVKVIILSSFGDGSLIKNALAAGAKGYLLKDMMFKDIALAIKSIHKGAWHFAPRIIDSLAKTTSPSLHWQNNLAVREVSAVKSNKNRSRSYDNFEKRVKKGWLYQLVPGLTVISVLALVATFVNMLPGFKLFSPLILSIFLGIFVRNTVGIPNICLVGINFSLKRILKLAIVLLGLQLSLEKVIEVGKVGLTIVILTSFVTFVFTTWLGKRLGVSRKLTQLMAAGVSVCGASAVIASNTVVNASDEDVAYALASVTLFGTASMLLYPLLPGLLDLTPQAFGLWCGVSIHESAQVIAAAFQNGKVSGEIATISKLSRVLLLAPMVLGLGATSNTANSNKANKEPSFSLLQIPIPWFVMYFLGVIFLNGFNIFPIAVKEQVIEINQFLLATSLAAMGLKTSLLELKQAGVNPLYLGATSWLFVSIFSLIVLKIFY